MLLGKSIRQFHQGLGFMVLSAEGVRKRFLFPSEVWDVRLTPPLKKCLNSITCQALMCVFALKGASGAENFLGSPEGVPSGLQG